MSNFKLSKLQKQELRTFKRDNPSIKFFSFPEYGVTVGIRDNGGRMADFAVSIASMDEQKFRRKVGEYKVAERFDSYQYLPCEVSCDSHETAIKIAEAVISG